MTKNLSARWRYFVPQFLFALEILPYFTILTEIHYHRLELKTLEVFSFELWLFRRKIITMDIFYREKQ